MCHKKGKQQRQAKKMSLKRGQRGIICGGLDGKGEEGRGLEDGEEGVGT